jgi:hypothetical protein
MSKGMRKMKREFRSDLFGHRFKTKFLSFISVSFPPDSSSNSNKGRERREESIKERDAKESISPILRRRGRSRRRRSHFPPPKDRQDIEKRCERGNLN